MHTVSETTPLAGDAFAIGSGTSSPSCDDSIVAPSASRAIVADPKAWCQSLAKRLSWTLLATIYISHHQLKGLVAGGGDEGLIGKPVEFLFAAQHVPASRLQAFVTMGLVLPWVAKPLIGFFSDAAPLFGYRKKPYIVMLTALAIPAYIVLGLGVVEGQSLTVAALFFASLQVAGTTFLIDARQSEIATKHPGLGPELITFREMCMNSGMLLSALVVGPLIAFAGPRMPYLVALPIAACPLVLALGNWMREERLPAKERGVNVDVLRRSQYTYGLGFLLLPLLLVLACGCVAKLGVEVLAAVAVFGFMGVTIGYALFVRPEISRPMIFYFISQCLSLQINGALFYFLTDSPAEFPEGPHFSPLVYAGGISTFAVAGRMVGVVSARDLFGQWRYDEALSLTIPLAACVQLLLVPVILRWNVAWGVPDLLSVLGWTFISKVVCGWRQMSFSLILLQATPRGLEASTLALNSSVANLGGMISVFFGGFALDVVQVQPRGQNAESSSFDGLWKAQVAAAMLPLLAMPLVPLLVPRCRHNETLVVSEPASATHGALAWGCCGA
mmetsp:Transcript_13456/g.36236  ORF Transcript_13456/g.36236 Transcript_13456/m.36236 type:complete len:558 (+) Transcript_13456:126-1799(+)